MPRKGLGDNRSRREDEQQENDSEKIHAFPVSTILNDSLSDVAHRPPFIDTNVDAARLEARATFNWLRTCSRQVTSAYAEWPQLGLLS
jgi:hypothetical protein